MVTYMGLQLSPKKVWEDELYSHSNPAYFEYHGRNTLIYIYGERGREIVHLPESRDININISPTFQYNCHIPSSDQLQRKLLPSPTKHS